jgi:F0F1-type ATP synthase assembly protein I
MTETPPHKNGDASLWSAVSLAWELGYLIALPIVILGFGAAYLDKQLGTSPFFLLLGIALAFTFSAIAVIRKVRSIQ